MGEGKSARRLLLLLAGLFGCAGIALAVWLVFLKPGTLTNAGGRPGSGPPTQSHGHFGEGFWWSAGDHAAIVGWPKKLAPNDRPAFVVLLHFPGAKTSTHFAHHSSHSGDDWEVEMEGAVGFEDGRRFAAKYAVSAKDPLEQFVADGKTYSADAGRVFLIDLSGPSPRITQVASELKGRIRNPASDSDPTPALREALDNLRGQHEEVRRFLAGSELK